MNKARIKYVAAVIACATSMGAPSWASVTQAIHPSTIRLGESAQLTIAASSTEATSIAPPMTPGLEFVAVEQSQRIESINGVSRATTSITYQVIPQRTGVFSIPSGSTGDPPVVLTVNAGNGSPSRSNPPTAGTVPRGAMNTQAGAAIAENANGSAFVRLRLSKHDLYVGETIPVDIEVGTRDGVVASLNGQPTLNGDAFTLDKLSPQPQRTSEIIEGKPFTVFTWHSALAAVKPGHLSLTMETPLTVRIRNAARADSGVFGQSDLAELFNDPTLQSFFGTSTEKDVTVASSVAAFDVQALPTSGRPAEFSGAVGHFTVSSDVSEDTVAAGDPLTLRLHVAGSGNFDRVNSLMLHDVEHLKTYAPTATFKAEDSAGYVGEKTFDQPVIATQPGAQALPALTFSWFDPSTRHYVEARTSPLRLDVKAADASQSSAASNASSGQPPASTGVAAKTAGSGGLRPDHPESGSASPTLSPHYFAAPYVAAPSTLALAFLSAGFWVRRRQRRREHMLATRAQEEALQTAPLLEQMNRAAAASNAELFFTAARQAVQRALAARWHLAPSNVTLLEARTRLGPQTDVSRLFELADEASYSKIRVTMVDFKHWQRVVLQQIGSGMVS